MLSCRLRYYGDSLSWKAWPIRASIDKYKIWELAEGVGFEPTVGYPTLDFESSALNRTQPPFHSRKIDTLLIDSEKSAFIMRRARSFANPPGGCS